MTTCNPDWTVSCFLSFSFVPVFAKGGGEDTQSVNDFLLEMGMTQEELDVMDSDIKFSHTSIVSNTAPQSSIASSLSVSTSHINSVSYRIVPEKSSHSSSAVIFSSFFCIHELPKLSSSQPRSAIRQSPSGGAISKAGGMDCGGRSGGFCILV